MPLLGSRSRINFDGTNIFAYIDQQDYFSLVSSKWIYTAGNQWLGSNNETKSYF